MYKKLSTRSNIFISLVFITISILISFVFNDWIDSIDDEIGDFFAGFFLVLGIVIITSVIFKSKNKKNE